MFPSRTFPVLLIASVMVTASCSSVEYNTADAPHMVVVAAHTPFYYYGPAQENGPDHSLLSGEEVRVMRKEIGYSYVILNDGQRGYVANEALKPAPARPSEPAPIRKRKPVTTQSPSFRY